MVCPVWAEFGRSSEISDDLRAKYVDDPRCIELRKAMSMAGEGAMPGTMVDDGSAILATGLPGAQKASEALARGEVVVSDPKHLWQDGKVRLTPWFGAEVGDDLESVIIPGTYVNLPAAQYGMILPLSALPSLGLEKTLAGLVGAPDRMPTPAEQAEAQKALLTVSPLGRLQIERGFEREDVMMYFSALFALALVVGLGATGIILSLAAVESRPDMATLSAIGASPRIRRRLASAQAAFTTGLGAVIGTCLGIGFGFVLLLTFRSGSQAPAPDNWSLQIPWTLVAVIVLAVPLCAALGAYVLTRSHLPMTRRIGS